MPARESTERKAAAAETAADDKIAAGDNIAAADKKQAAQQKVIDEHMKRMLEDLAKEAKPKRKNPQSATKPSQALSNRALKGRQSEQPADVLMSYGCSQYLGPKASEQLQACKLKAVQMWGCGWTRMVRLSHGELIQVAYHAT